MAVQSRHGPPPPPESSPCPVSAVFTIATSGRRRRREPSGSLQGVDRTGGRVLTTDTGARPIPHPPSWRRMRPMIADDREEALPVLKVSDLAIAPGDAPVLKDISITLQRGTLLAIVGPSGCGKTSLLRTIAGLDDAAAGEVRLHDRSPDDIGWPAYRRVVTLVQQQPVMLDDTVLENLVRPFRHRSVSLPFDRRLAIDLLETLGLTERCLGQRARTLSVGEQQRVALLRAILIEPEVLLLDEPTSALDEESQVIIEQVLRLQVRRHGRSAIVVTHDRRQADRLCDAQLDLQPHVIQYAQRRGVVDA